MRENVGKRFEWLGTLVAERVELPREVDAEQRVRVDRVVLAHRGDAELEIAADAPADDQRPSNVLVLVAPDGTPYRYRKIHPFSLAREPEHYGAGTEVFTADVEGVRVTPFVCYDLRFADDFWKLAPETDAYVVVANWPAARTGHWRALLLARAIENQAYVVGCNRVGHGGSIELESVEGEGTTARCVLPVRANE